MRSLASKILHQSKMDSRHLAPEIFLGKKLGEGAFCEVYKIANIQLKPAGDNSSTSQDGGVSGRSSFRLLSGERQEDEGYFPLLNMFQNKSEIRQYMADHCTLEGGRVRYALKRVKATQTQEQFEECMVDLAIDAQFLACFDHPNIIKMRGVTGKPLSPFFTVILDRLHLTLEDQMKMWAESKKQSSKSRFFSCFSLATNQVVNQNLINLATKAAYQLKTTLCTTNFLPPLCVQPSIE